MRASLQPMGADLLCQMPGGAVEELRIAGSTGAAPTLLEQLQGFAARYERATVRGATDEWLAIGTELFALLDSNGWATAFAGSAGERVLSIQVGDPTAALAAALLDAPWELLAGAQGHLAGDGLPLFVTERRIGRPQAPLAPCFSDIKLMFMASAPEGVHELDFEAEEAAILQATRRLRLHLVVEETGALAPLRERLSLDGEEPFDALHLSCHGGIHPAHGPMLMLEAEDGGSGVPATPQELVHAIGNTALTPLVFVSACRTAEQQAAGPTSHAAPALESFVRQLVRAGVHNVLGWDGSVYDTDAQQFAASFYGELVAGRDVPAAVAHARQALLRQHRQDPRQGSHWHLARLYLGSHGGGPLVRRGAPQRRLANAARRDAFLDRGGRSPVAPRERFVGRRRPLQAVLRAFSRQAAGVLVQGMGNLGKSSLAARVRDRLTDWTPVVVFQQFDAAALIDALIDAAPAVSREDLRRTWRQDVIDRPGRLADALENLLLDHFDQQPILMILDDLEQALECPAADAGAAEVPVLPDYRDSLGAVLRVFAQVPGRSRLLLTSRYRFSLRDGRGTDLAAALHLVPLLPMAEGEQHKQLRAAAPDEATRNALRDDGRLNELAARALAIAQGNPGLQNVLTRPLLNGEVAAAERALVVCEDYLRRGLAPASLEALRAQGLAGDTAHAMLAFFTRQALSAYRDALTPSQRILLRVACAFSAGLAVPTAALTAGAIAWGVSAGEAAAGLRRLLALGLLDDWGSGSDGAPQAAANPLAAPLGGTLAENELCAWATAVQPALVTAWMADGRAPVDRRALELWRVLCLADAAASPALDATAVAAARLLNDAHQPVQARDVVLKPAWQKLSAQGQTPGTGLVHLCFDVASSTGDTDLADAAAACMASRLGEQGAEGAGSSLLRLGRRALRLGHLDDALQHFRIAERHFSTSAQPRNRAIAFGGQADILGARGQLDEALRIRTEEELPVYERLGDVRSKAITQGKIADILQARGRLDEALRIRTEEELPVYERLGDVRSKAITQGQIADILEARGQLDEALRIRTEEELPVYERLGDVREKAITQGQIADILQARGQLDEALRIRTEEELPVYERLGDVREKAITQGKIADILQARGQLDEALRIRTEEQLPVYERLGDVRSKAITQGKIADILQARGQLDEALRIRTEEELPVYERLGDVREKAITQGKIADILQARGQLDEALRIRTEEQLPVYERLGDVRSKAITQGKIADILQARGRLDEALRIRTEEELPVYERLGDVREKAITQGKIADILQARGQLDEALRIRTEEQLPVYERLGDVRSKAITQGQIADILQARGQLDEALRIRTEEELPVYERLGDVREKAITQGKIADILQARGQLDEAQELHEQCLPVYRVLGDEAGIGHVRYCLARIALDRGDHEREGGLQAIHDNLWEAWESARQAGRANAVAGIGTLLAQVLAMGRAFERANAVLDVAGSAFERMGVEEGIAHVVELRRRINAMRDSG